MAILVQLPGCCQLRFQYAHNAVFHVAMFVYHCSPHSAIEFVLHVLIIAGIHS